LSALARARAWHHGRQAAICDVVEPWSHGTVLRATRWPSYYDFNLVRVEEFPAPEVEALIAVADEALGDLEHRRIDFDAAESAEPLRPELEARGWKTLRLVVMRHDAPAGPSAGLAVEEVSYDSVDELRSAWYREDFPDQDPGSYHSQAREVALRRGTRVLAVREQGRPVAYAELERDGEGAEIVAVYVSPGRRGSGLGTALTRTAIEAAGPVRDLWIGADDEDRPKELYARLGFRPAWYAVECTRWPR
jgi:GNAT superfamily N-acetyltransferase